MILYLECIQYNVHYQNIIQTDYLNIKELWVVIIQAYHN